MSAEILQILKQQITRLLPLGMRRVRLGLVDYEGQLYLRQYDD